MNLPNFKANDLEIFNKSVPLNEMNRVSNRSRVGLYLSQVLLYIGFGLIMLNNINVLEPGSYFGSDNWLTIVVFSIGLIINFVAIPWLYFSSFEDFKKENDFWDREVFWILPLFFFGTFFLYGSRISTSYFLLLLSIAVIVAVHFTFVRVAWDLAKRNSKGAIANCRQYVISLQYLTAYYMLLLGLLFFYNPLQHVVSWIYSY